MSPSSATRRGRGASPVIDPQFELAFSGWYWQITRLDLPRPEIRTSRSLFATQLPRLGGSEREASAARCAAATSWGPAIARCA